LAKELKMEVRELIQRLKDDLGLQENFTYLSSLDEPIVARARQVISAATPQVEELRWVIISSAAAGWRRRR